MLYEVITRVIARVAVDRGLAVLTSETHGMAQRGGTVLSTVKVGTFASPLIRAGQADVGLLLCVITSYSIHYTKLYELEIPRVTMPRMPWWCKAPMKCWSTSM